MLVNGDTALDFGKIHKVVADLGAGAFFESRDLLQVQSLVILIVSLIVLLFNLVYHYSSNINLPCITISTDTDSHHNRCGIPGRTAVVG